VAVNDNTISFMPLSRRWRFVTICGEGPGPRAVPRGRRLAPGPRACRASAVRVPRRTTWAWPARVTWPRTSRLRTRRRPPSRRRIGGWSTARPPVPKRTDRLDQTVGQEDPASGQQRR